MYLSTSTFPTSERISIKDHASTFYYLNTAQQQRQFLIQLADHGCILQVFVSEYRAPIQA